MEVRYESVETCARCGGRFPGPGVGWRGEVYCCDNCAAAGERMGLGRFMLARALPVAGLMLGAAALALGWRTNGGGGQVLRLGRALSAAGCAGAASRLAHTVGEQVGPAWRSATALLR